MTPTPSPAKQEAIPVEKHTPGPWMVFDHYCGRDVETAGEEYARTRLIGLGQFDTIAEVRHGHDDIAGDVDANARLIAAAPDLLEACESLLLIIPGADASPICRLAQAAILKATQP